MKFEEMLKKRRDILSEYLKLSLKQRDCIENEELDRLLQVLDEKQKLIDEMDRMEELRGLDGEGGIIKEEILNLLKEIRDIEEECYSSLYEKYSELCREIKDVNVTRKIRSYGEMQGETGIFIDRKK